MATPAFQALLLLCWCRGKESNRQYAAAEAQLKWVFVRGEVSLLSRTNVCAHLHLKSQSRDNIFVPLSGHRHRVQWRCLWRARRLLRRSSVLKFSTRTLLVWYSHSEKVSGMNGFLFTSPFTCTYFTGRFLRPFALLWSCVLLLGFLPGMILWKLFTSSHL